MVKAQATEVWQALFSYVTLFHHTRIHLSDFQCKPQALIYHPENTNTHNDFTKPHPDSWPVVYKFSILLSWIRNHAPVHAKHVAAGEGKNKAEKRKNCNAQIWEQEGLWTEIKYNSFKILYMPWRSSEALCGLLKYFALLGTSQDLWNKRSLLNSVQQLLLQMAVFGKEQIQMVNILRMGGDHHIK